MYLDMEQKRKLALNGEDVPICMRENGYIRNQRYIVRNGYIVKIKSIFDGSLIDKKFEI